MADWWDRLYDDSATDTSATQPAPEARAQRVVSVRRPGTAASTIGGGRLPDWRSGQVANLTKPDPAAEAEGPGPAAAPTPAARAAVQEAEAEEEAEQDDEATEPEAPEEDKATRRRWDPVHLSERIAARGIQAQKQRPIGKRLRGLATTKARPNIGRLFYAATGIGAAWRVGLTPWLMDLTADAPAVVLVAIAVIGWAIYRLTDKALLPVAWAGHATFTATVIALTPHL